MENMLIQLATMPGGEGRENEDFAGALPSCAVLLDGSGGPAELPSGCVHGVPWYVRQLGARALAGMETAPDSALAEILAGCIAEVSDLHRGTCDLAAPGTPATIAVMARARGDAFEYLVLGDSTIVIDADGKLAVVSDRRIDDVATAEKRAMEALPTGTPQHQAARIRFVTRQRELRNRPGGYWIASTDPQAAHEALTGSVPLAGMRRATLMSDGTTRFAEFGLGSWGELLSMLDLWGPAAVFARIRAAEDGDPDGSRWPRAKRRDDVAVVHFTTFRRDGWGHVDLESVPSGEAAA
jgi:Protein phosphatase 2C